MPTTKLPWPGSDSINHPQDTVYNPSGVPRYPDGTTCKMLGEDDAFFPITWHLFLLSLIVVTLYIVWPLYVLRHLMRRKSIYGDQDAFEANHDMYKYGERSAQYGEERLAE